MMYTAARPAEEEDATHSAFEARISAWIDGEDNIRPEDVATPYGRQLWDTYHLIGDVMRSDDLALRPSPWFYARISKAIDAEPVVVAPPTWWSRRTTRSGLAVAALAMIAWIALPYFTATNINPDHSVVLTSARDDNMLRDYLDAHGHIPGSAFIQHAAFGNRRP